LNQFSSESDEAISMMRLAAILDLSGDCTEARSWYQRVVDLHQIPISARAKGALRRLDAKGEPFGLHGKVLGTNKEFDIASLDGQRVVVIFWAYSALGIADQFNQMQTQVPGLGRNHV
jgi:hypothetical protein